MYLNTYNTMYYIHECNTLLSFYKRIMCLLYKLTFVLKKIIFTPHSLKILGAL